MREPRVPVDFGEIKGEFTAGLVLMSLDTVSVTVPYKAFLGRKRTHSFRDEIIISRKHLHLENTKLALDRIKLVHDRSDIVIFL